MAFADTTPRKLLFAWGQSRVTLGQACTVGDLLGLSGNLWVLADASGAGILARYVAAEPGAVDDEITVFRMAIIEAAYDATDPGEIGDVVYLSDTAGGTGLVVGTVTQVVGWVDSADTILVQPRNPLALDASDIANDTIDSQHYVADSIDSEHYAAGSVDSTAIATGAVGSAEIATGAVDSAEIAAGAIDSSHYGAGSVDSTAIATGAVDSAEIAAGAIDSSHYGDGSIDTEHYAAGSVDSTAIMAGAVDSTAIATGAVDSAEIAAGAIDSSHYGDGSIDSEHYAAGSVDTTALAANVHGIYPLTIVTGVSTTTPVALHVHSPVAGIVVAVDFVNSSGGTFTAAGNVMLGTYITAVASSGATLIDGATTTDTSPNTTYDDVAAAGAVTFTPGASSAGGDAPQSCVVWIEYEINDL